MSLATAYAIRKRATGKKPKGYADGGEIKDIASPAPAPAAGASGGGGSGGDDQEEDAPTTGAGALSSGMESLGKGLAGGAIPGMISKIGSMAGGGGGSGGGGGGMSSMLPMLAMAAAHGGIVGRIMAKRHADGGMIDAEPDTKEDYDDDSATDSTPDGEGFLEGASSHDPKKKRKHMISEIMGNLHRKHLGK